MARKILTVFLREEVAGNMQHRHVVRAMAFTVMSLVLAGCGVTPGCRAVSTGAFGAGTGAALTAIAGGPIGLGATIGGATGAINGAATSSRLAYLGGSPICF